MGKIFLDVNKLVSFVKGDDNDGLMSLGNNDLFVSVLSWHILAYLMKWNIPNVKLTKIFNTVVSIEMKNHLVFKSMEGPTNDFEDNVQLHSATDSECDIFLTKDQKLLKMKYFGKMKIVDKI